jgi:ribonuclease D
LQIPEADWPVLPKTRRSRPSKEQTDRFESLKKTRDQVAAEINLDPSIIAPRSALEAASVDLNTPALMRWQRTLLGLDSIPSA